MLYCITCSRVAEIGSNRCRGCSNTIVQMACAACGKLVPRGATSCPCRDNNTDYFPDSGPVPGTTTASPGALTRPPFPGHPSTLSPPGGLPPITIHINAPAYAPPPGPNLPPAVIAPAPVPESYIVRRFGVEAEVFANPADIEILNEMGSVVVILHTLAEHMNRFSGVMQSTRALQKACRNLASDLQEEIETRRGPQG